MLRQHLITLNYTLVNSRRNPELRINAIRIITLPLHTRMRAMRRIRNTAFLFRRPERHAIDTNHASTSTLGTAVREAAVQSYTSPDFWVGDLREHRGDAAFEGDGLTDYLFHLAWFFDGGEVRSIFAFWESWLAFTRDFVWAGGGRLSCLEGLASVAGGGDPA